MIPPPHRNIDCPQSKRLSPRPTSCELENLGSGNMKTIFRHTIETQRAPLKISMLCINHKVITHVALLLKTPQLNYLYLTRNLMQNKITKCGDPAIFTDYSITEPIFTVCQEYNNYNNSNKGITDPTGFKEVREYLKKVRVLISSPDLIFNLSLRTYTSSPSALARLSNPRPLSMTRTTMKSKLSEAMWMSLWVRPMDPLLPRPVLIPCVSQLIIQVSLLHSTAHFLS